MSTVADAETATTAEAQEYDSTADESGQKDVKEDVRKLREFHVEELKEFDGTKTGKPILVALLGDVYDVTPGKKFYGPGGPYAVFAGRDATRGLATFRLVFKASEESKHCHCDLSSRHIENAKRWQITFKQKYKVVGTLVSECSCSRTANGTSPSGEHDDGEFPMSFDAEQRPRNILSGMCAIL